MVGLGIRFSWYSQAPWGASGSSGLLVDEGAGVDQDAVVEFGVEPGHGESGGAAGASAEGHAGVGVFGEV